MIPFSTIRVPGIGSRKQLISAFGGVKADGKSGADVRCRRRRRGSRRSSRVAAARGDYEAVQVVFAPGTRCGLLAAELVAEAALGASRAITGTMMNGLREVTKPTDKTCVDRLVPTRCAACDAMHCGRTNQPLWLTVYVGTRG